MNLPTGILPIPGTLFWWSLMIHPWGNALHEQYCLWDLSEWAGGYDPFGYLSDGFANHSSHNSLWTIHTTFLLLYLWVLSCGIWDTIPDVLTTYVLLMLHFCKSLPPTNHDKLASASQAQACYATGWHSPPSLKRRGSLPYQKILSGWRWYKLSRWYLLYFSNHGWWYMSTRHIS